MGKGWQIIARIILRWRIPLLILVLGATAFMWHNRSTERMHDFGKVVPQNDPDYIDYKAFREEFGDDGNILAIGFEGEVFKLEVFNAIFALTDSLKKVSGVTNVLSIANAVELVADPEGEKYLIQRIASRPAADQAEMDSLKKQILRLPFYKGLLISDSANAIVVAVTIDPKRLDSKEKGKIVGEIVERTKEASAAIGMHPHFSGLPFIRAYITEFIPREMIKFLILAVLVMSIFLYLTFRAFSAVIIPVIIVGIVIIFVLGMMGLLGYKITMITAVLPALISVIGVPNSIYLLTKYHFEYRRTGNKIKSLILLIQKIGIVTVMTNATTAVGFGVLVFTKIQMLKEFGILAALSVVVTFFVSLLLIPIFFSFLPAPGRRHMRHIDRKILGSTLDLLDRLVLNYRHGVYVFSLALAALAIWGMSELRPRSLIVDDIPKDGVVIADLEFLESHFHGVMPFEIVVNTHTKGGIIKYGTLKNLDRFQTRMQRFDEISRSLSVLDIIKFARQSLLSGVETEYQVPSREELMIIQIFLKNSELPFGIDKEGAITPDTAGAQKSESPLARTKILDKDRAKARIKANVKDIGATRLAPIIDSLYQDLEDIFVQNNASGSLEPNTNYRLFGDEDFRISYKGRSYDKGDIFQTDTTSTYETLGGNGKVDYSDRFKITGTTKIFIKSNEFLINNLVQSLILAFLVIAVLMAILFGSFKMVIIALLPNVLPMMLTAGIMGFMGIPLKPSTVLIFSVAFGIAVDDTIHFLARYRLARKTGFGVKLSVSNSFKDTGVSMIYTSIILFFGFVIFSFSDYGGTAALGQLTSLTLLIALFTNLILLPSLLISLNKDEEQLPEGYLNYEEEQEDVEAIREFIGNENEENGDDDDKTLS